MSTLHSKPITSSALADQLLRGCIPVGANPAQEDAYINWRRLEAAQLEWANDEDGKLFRYLQTWVTQFAHVVFDDRGERMTCEMPELAMIRQYFETADEIEVVTRLDEIKAAQPYIRTNYRSLVETAKENERTLRLGRILSRASNINVSGERGKGKEVLRGYRAAATALLEDLRKFEGVASDTPWGESTDVSEPVDPVRYLIKHYRLAEGRPNGLVGYAGSAKTFLAIELCIAVAAGLKTVWGGCELSLSGPVVHLDYEMGKKASARRYQRVAEVLGVNLRGLTTSKALDVRNFPGTNLVTEGAEASLIRLCQGKSLLLIDSFRAATAGGEADENSSAFRSYLDMLSRVSDETGVIVLVIHHERKSPAGGDTGVPKVQQMRGSSGLADAFGATVHVEPVKEGGFNIVQGKVSMGRTGASKRCRLVDDGDYNPVHDDTNAIVIENVEITDDEASKPFKQVEAVYNVIDGKTSVDAVTKALQTHKAGMRKERILEVIAQLELEGRIVKNGKTWRIVPVRTFDEYDHAMTAE